MEDRNVRFWCWKKRCPRHWPGRLYNCGQICINPSRISSIPYFHTYKSIMRSTLTQMDSRPAIATIALWCGRIMGFAQSINDWGLPGEEADKMPFIIFWLLHCASFSFFLHRLFDIPVIMYLNVRA